MWIINTGPREVETVSQLQKRWISFKPGVPISIQNTQEGMDIISRFASLRICDKPEEYFTGRPMKYLVIRDAGIGDLLLLEPILRKIKKERKSIEIDVLTGYPEVYEGNPSVSLGMKMQSKDNLPLEIVSSYDDSCDLRSYSETAESRHTKHRTDVYLERFDVTMTDEEKEPRLHLSPDDKYRFRKIDGDYVGVSVEASHRFRGLPESADICKSILASGRIPVMLGWKSDEKMPKGTIDLRGKTTVCEMFSVVSQLDSLVAVDSGVMHVGLTLHIPTVCIFTIITPDLRIRYYRGQKQVVTAPVQCIGCGDYHMIECKQLRGKAEPIAPCQRVSIPQIMTAINSFTKDKKAIYTSEKAPVIEVVGPKLNLSFMVLNEARNIPHFIKHVVKHPCIGRAVCIDGGSTDSSVALLRGAGVEVYIHPYLKEYHDAQAMQRNISMSYFRDGEKVLIMDPDEMFSQELSKYLGFLANSDIKYGIIARRTFKTWEDAKDPMKQIKDFPDYQPRFYTWDRRYKFVGSPHHQTLNVPEPMRIDCPIIHAECEGKDRNALEKQWAEMWKKTKEVY